MLFRGTSSDDSDSCTASPRIVSFQFLQVDGDGFKVGVRNVVSHKIGARVCGVAGPRENVAGRDAKFEDLVGT